MWLQIHFSVIGRQKPVFMILAAGFSSRGGTFEQKEMSHLRQE
jgi:hypothetical protein